MSKYQRLSSQHDQAPEDDENISLFLDNSYSSLSEDTFEQRLPSSTNSSGGYSRSEPPNGSTSTDDSFTMEVPLLHNNNNEYEQPLNAHGLNYDCICNQPGFAANPANKSTQDAKLKILLAICLCGVFMMIEFIGGYFAGSLAIMSDAAHLASDCISFIIGLVAIWLGTKPPDKRMSFGYKRMEVVGAIVSILSIWILTATLVTVAVQRVFSNDFHLDVNTMMTISAIGIGINIVMIFILHGSVLSAFNGHVHSHAHAHSHAHSHFHAHAPTAVNVTADGNSTLVLGNGLKHAANGSIPTERNLNLRAAIIHVIGDLVQSIGVFLASVLIKFCPSAKFADPLCTILFSFIVIMTTVQLFKESVSILLDAVPQNVCLEELENDLNNIEGVKFVHHLNVWNHSSNHSVLMVHLVVDLLTDSNTVLQRATNLACSSKYNIKHCTIQIERVTS